MITNVASPVHTNRLAREKSPYLLQHQHNPVDWFPWGEEAFAKAQQDKKPILLSIGYSTCHWCHVMERESFEDTAVAAYLNEHFVSIKVDREERPDVDRIYMTAVQALTGQGGWPLNVFLTPDLKPFYGGTYFPREGRQGLPGFLQLLRQIHQVWENRGAELSHSAAELHRRLTQLAKAESASGLVLTPSILHAAAAQFKEEFDSRGGGFGGAPKFPRPSQPAFLLRYGMRFLDQDAVDMVLYTCDCMAAGGIHDQIGGGFARYSVDAQWQIPHFEKMLYDNAQLANLYLDAFLVSGEPRFARVAQETLGYVMRDLAHPDGGWYSAEDADSEGKEGKFYCWTRAELANLLEPEEFKVASRHFGVTDQGNFLDHSDPNPLPNQNVLTVADSNVPTDERPLLDSAKQKMFAARLKRARPLLDDKVLTSWNGLTLGAMARAYAVLGEPAYLMAAEKNLVFLQKHLWNSHDKILSHRWRDGESDAAQLIDDHAFLLGGVLDLYEATLDPRHLEFAIALAGAMIAHFYDQEHGGFWQSPVNTPHLILRVKDDYDSAEPSGNSAAILALLRLAAITDRAELKHAAEQSLRLFAHRLQNLPQAVPHMLCALDFWLEEPKRVVIAGRADQPKTLELLRATHAVYQPNKVVLGSTGPVEPFAKTLPPADEQPLAYVCTAKSCLPPTHEPAKLRAMLR